MKPKSQKVVVTGGGGFIGSHLVDTLMRENKDVTVFDNFSSGKRENLNAHANDSKLRIIDGDVRNPSELLRSLEGADLVYHLATHCVRLSLTEPMTNHEINATGTLNVLAAAKKVGVRRFVYCSSSEVFGASETDGNLNEHAPKNPTTVYGASKLIGEHYAHVYHLLYDLPSMVVRPFNAYGPRSHLFGPYGEVIPRFSIMCLAGRQPVIFGDGNQTRDFTYVEDIAAGLVACASTDALLGSSVNLAKGTKVSVNQLATTIAKIVGSSLKPKYVGERPGDIRSLGADVSKAKVVLPRVPSVELEEGLARYIHWLRTQRLDFGALADRLIDQNWAGETTKSARFPRAA